MSFKSTFLLLSAVALLGGCASNKMKERKDQREKAVHTSKLYCDFINGDIYPDLEVALNIEMAKRCDSEKPYTMTQYKTASESTGIMYCCTTTGLRPVAPIAIFDKNKKSPLEDKKETKPAEPKKDAPKDDLEELQ